LDFIKNVLLWLWAIVVGVPFYILGFAVVFGLAYRIFDECVLDPRRIRLIREHFAALGYSDVNIQRWHAHYGIRFRRNGKSRYVKCTVKKGEIQWIGDAPDPA